MLPTNIPSLKTLHLNVWFLATEHTSFVLDVSLKNKYLPEPPAYIREIINADDDNPSKILIIKSLVLITHFLYILINISKKK